MSGRNATCRGCLVGHVKVPRQKSTDEDDSFVSALLAQAEAIKDNPDEFLPVEAVDGELVNS